MSKMSFAEVPKKYLDEYCEKQSKNFDEVKAYRMANPTADEKFKAWKAGRQTRNGVPSRFIKMQRLMPINNPEYFPPGDDPLPTREDLVNELNDALDEVANVMKIAMEQLDNP